MPGRSPVRAPRQLSPSRERGPSATAPRVVRAVLGQTSWAGLRSRPAYDGVLDPDSAVCSTICRMGTLTIRTDPEVERALAFLTGDGRSRSEAVRAAILAAERELRRARLRAEAEALRDDPEDLAASRALAADMDAIRAW